MPETDDVPFSPKSREERLSEIRKFFGEMRKQIKGEEWEETYEVEEEVEGRDGKKEKKKVQKTRKHPAVSGFGPFLFKTKNFLDSDPTILMRLNAAEREALADASDPDAKLEEIKARAKKELGI